MPTPSFYSVKSFDGQSFHFVKFDEDLNVVTEYDTSHEACTCPAGVRETCRHRTMLREFLSRKRVNTDWFFSPELSQWSQPFGDLTEVEPAQAEPIVPKAKEAEPVIKSIIDPEPIAIPPSTSQSNTGFVRRPF